MTPTEIRDELLALADRASTLRQEMDRLAREQHAPLHVIGVAVGTAIADLRRAAKRIA